MIENITTDFNNEKLIHFRDELFFDIGE
jgi:hypothetical protein